MEYFYFLMVQNMVYSIPSVRASIFGYPYISNNNWDASMCGEGVQERNRWQKWSIRPRGSSKFSVDGAARMKLVI